MVVGAGRQRGIAGDAADQDGGRVLVGLGGGRGNVEGDRALPSSTVRVAGAERFGASACSLTVTLMEVVAAAEVSVSVSVAVTVRVMACVDSPVVRVRPAELSGGERPGAVMVEGAGRQRGIAGDAADQDGGRVLVGLGGGRGNVEGDRALPSSTVRVAGAERFGASACSLTVTLMVLVAAAEVSVSVSVAVTVRVMAVCGLAGCEGEAGELGGGERPGAVMVVGAGRQRGIGRDAADHNGGRVLVGLGGGGGNVEGDRAACSSTVRRGRRRQVRGVGLLVDGDVDRGLRRRRGVGLGVGRGDGEGDGVGGLAGCEGEAR